MKKRDLAALRREIDKVDKKIALDLKKRFALVGEIARYKLAKSMKIEDKERDSEVARNYGKVLSSDDAHREFTREFIRLILKHSKKIQENVIKNEKRKN